ncbi:MAG: helix-turn-helix domain-containing protein [Cyanobacteria bacterium J06633_8]|uniref:hypothetical protein n=1 Tax=Rivularia sp. PCC 7116 TaxID=373994 RepID=UPI00029F3A58|nr:hypothetical protein [Rivularia sp. PCC 7116]AFY57443.1 hypothetical protein Riv7116_5041 [Rivularia sp. PCC 7116]
MNTPSLTQREKDLIRLYCSCKFEMTPQEFYRKWQVSQENIAEICSRSVSTVRYWFCRGRFYRRPLAQDLRHLALMDFLLESFEEIPSKILDKLCLSKNKQSDTTK